MRWALLAALTFFSGAVFELACVFWVHHSERGQPGRTAMWSMVVATSNVFGIGESLHDVKYAPFFVAGYGVGSYVAVLWKTRGSKLRA